MRSGEVIGHYRLERILGAGGMGQVYAARDLTLDRPVAVKLIHEALGDPRMRERFRREARAAAALNHPGVCHVYEISEHAGELFIAMELLEGEPLVDRLQRGALPLDQAVKVGLALLETLAALHARGFVHRDLKPSNVFLLPDGRVKLLDFGLALSTGATDAGATHLTMPGHAVGSPGYMAPEQVLGQPIDARTDLFAVGALLYEAVAGRRAFAGANAVEMSYAVLNKPPPPLTGTPRVEAVGRVIARALAHEAARWPDAAAMAAALRDAIGADSGSEDLHTAAPAPVRLAVLPFRMLRPDPDKEFLCASLPEAIALSLSGLRSLVVRSTMATARYAGGTPDLRELANELEVDVVLTGTLLPAGERCRLAAQLVETPGGRVVWSQTSDVTAGDIFELQDQLTRRIVSSLEIPLSARERHALAHDVPASPAAYECYLRGNLLVRERRDLQVARALYEKAVAEDPGFAPAWARLGRCHRVIGKYFDADRAADYRRSEEAFARALSLHADFPMAHHGMAQLECDLGRFQSAIERLLRVVQHNPNDPEGWAGLVTAFRYAGMNQPSLAAHQRAVALDPHLFTSVEYTWRALGDYQHALDDSATRIVSNIAHDLAHLGREQEALALIASRTPQPATELFADLLRAAFTGDAAAVRAVVERHGDFPDPEGVFGFASALGRVGETAEALRWLTISHERGFANPEAIANEPWLENVRALPGFDALMMRVQDAHAMAVRTFGPALDRLGLPNPGARQPAG